MTDKTVLFVSRWWGMKFQKDIFLILCEICQEKVLEDQESQDVVYAIQILINQMVVNSTVVRLHIQKRDGRQNNEK